MKKILLIGGEGYIGNIVSEKLLSVGYSVTSFDNLIYGNNTCVLNHIHNPNYQFIYGDMLDKSVLERAIQESEIVVILAGLVGDPITKKYPRAAALINDDGIRNVVDTSVEKGISQLIFISTCSNYGLISNDDLADEEYKLNPLSLYAKSKVDSEKYILNLKGKTSMNSTILRFATAFGLSPRMRFDLTINEFTRELALGQELIVYDADTWRPYCHVQDFARLINRVIELPPEKTSFEIFNSGGFSNNATKRMIVDMILEKIPEGKVKYVEHGSDPRNYRVNFEKVKRILGFEPEYTIESGISELLNEINNHVFDNVDQNKSIFGNYEINYRYQDE